MFETSAERKDFDAEVQDAEEQGFSVEYVTKGGQIMVIMDLMGSTWGDVQVKLGQRKRWRKRWAVATCIL